MQRVRVRAAKAGLFRLIEAVLGGEEVVIARGGVAVVRLVPVVKAQFQIGVLAGELGDGPDFLAPLADDELAFWEGRG